MVEAKDYEKPCHTLNHCPYGWLVEFFPLNGKQTQWNGKSLDIEPVAGEGLDCRVFGHDCPIFYVGENIKD